MAKTAIATTTGDGRTPDHSNAMEPGTNPATARALGENKPRICIIDDEPTVLEDVAGLLEAAGWEVLTIDRVIGASNRIRHFAPDLLYINSGIKAVSSRDLVRILRRNISNFPSLVIYSWHDDERIETMALEAGADDLVVSKGGYGPLLSRVQYYRNMIALS